MSLHPPVTNSQAEEDAYTALFQAVNRLEIGHRLDSPKLYAELHQHHQAEIVTIMERLDTLEEAHDENEPRQMQEAHDNIVDRIIALANRIAKLELRK